MSHIYSCFCLAIQFIILRQQRLKVLCSSVWLADGHMIISVSSDATFSCFYMCMMYVKTQITCASSRVLFHSFMHSCSDSPVPQVQIRILATLWCGVLQSVYMRGRIFPSSRPGSSSHRSSSSIVIEITKLLVRLSSSSRPFLYCPVIFLSTTLSNMFSPYSSLCDGHEVPHCYRKTGNIYSDLYIFIERPFIDLNSSKHTLNLIFC